MRTGNFFFDGHLRGNALLDVFKRPPTRAQAFVLRIRRTSDGNDFVKMRSARVSNKSGMTTTARAAFSLRTIFDLREPEFADARM